MVNALHHTGLTVGDLDRSLAFYRLLGFEVVMEQEKRNGYLAEIVGYPEAHVRMAHLRAPGGEHGLELFEYLTPPGRPNQIEPRDVGLTHVCLVVDDLDSVYRRLVEGAECTPLSSPVDVDTGVNAGSKALYLRDPDGTIIELFEPGR